jgi:uncharacterized phage-like protein YoqJ
MRSDGKAASIGVTGHQPPMLGGYGDDVAARLETVAREWLKAAEPREVVSGMAAGWDLAVAAAAVGLGIPLVAALAFADQAAEWPADARAKYRRLVGASVHVHTHAAEKLYGCWAARDGWVLERSAAVLALWSGAEGGTGRAVAKALKLGRPVYNVWPEWLDAEGTRPQ